MYDIRCDLTCGCVNSSGVEIRYVGRDCSEELLQRFNFRYVLILRVQLIIALIFSFATLLFYEFLYSGWCNKKLEWRRDGVYEDLTSILLLGT